MLTESPTSNGTKEEKPAQTIHLERLKSETLHIPVKGVTSLIMHNWSEKSKAMMLEAQTTRARKKREVRDPIADYEAAFYRLEDGRPGMPAVAFKAAICDAARFYEGVTIVSLKTGIFVQGDGIDMLVPIEGPERMREDTARNATGVADLRFRPEFMPWSAILHVEFLPTMLTPESVYALVDASGRNGVGDWRPTSPKSRTGIHGQYRIEDH